MGSSEVTQLIALTIFLMAFIGFQNSMNNDRPYTTIDSNASITELPNVGFINQSTASVEGENILSTVKNLASFQIENNNYWISLIFWIAGLWIIILIWIILNPFK